MVDGDALIVPLNSKYPQRTCSLDEVYPAGEYTKDVEDNCKIFPSLNFSAIIIFTKFWSQHFKYFENNTNIFFSVQFFFFFYLKIHQAFSRFT